MAGARYVRFIIFALMSLVVIFFISSSSAPAHVTHHLQSTTHSLKDKFRGGLSKNAQGQKDTTVDLADLNRIPNPEVYNTPLPSPSPDISSEKLGSEGHPGEPSRPNTSGARMNATFVTLARNSDLWDLSESIRQVEDRFNHKFKYDWVFLNDKPFDDDFIAVTTKLVSGTTKYGLIPPEHWSFPSWIDQEKAAKVRADMDNRKVIYGGSVSYRHMCRFESGFFYRQTPMMDYEWYWRVEPGIKLFCDIDYDVFKYMADNKKKYSFVLSLFEYIETIPTLWDSVKTFTKDHPEHVAEDNSMAFLSDDGGNTYNKCHFWSNFEIGNLNWLRSPAYTDFFEHLDKDGGFFYERWGDAPVHSIAAGLLLQKDEIHFFNDIGYYHVPFTHCPNEESLSAKLTCRCNPKDNFDWNGYSCLAKYYDLHGLPHPDQH